MLLELLILGVVIGSNNFSVALALGALGKTSVRNRVIIIFGLFEFIVPLVGIWLGALTAKIIGEYANIIGAFILTAIGLWVIYEGFRHRSNDQALKEQVASWSSLILLGAGLSLDNLLVGFSLGLGEASPLAVASVIAIFAVLFTWLGFQLGCEARRRWERVVKIGAGVLLLLLGLASFASWL